MLGELPCLAIRTSLKILNPLNSISYVRQSQHGKVFPWYNGQDHFASIARHCSWLPLKSQLLAGTETSPPFSSTFFFLPSYLAFRNGKGCLPSHAISVFKKKNISSNSWNNPVGNDRNTSHPLHEIDKRKSQLLFWVLYQFTENGQGFVRYTHWTETFNGGTARKGKGKASVTTSHEQYRAVLLSFNTWQNEYAALRYHLGHGVRSSYPFHRTHS